ncbi:MAG: FecR domain-containing protein [Rhodothermia bacterium]|nr:FecR domain-containing protein [Rhodothermia bacterium]
MTHELFDIEDLSAEERRRLAERLRSDEDLRRQFVAWNALGAAIRDEQDQLLGDTKILVAYALEAKRRSFLSKGESAELAAARARLDAAMEDNPAVADIVSRIQQDADVFDKLWQSSTHRSGTKNRGPRPPRRSGAARLGWRIAAVAATAVFIGILLFIVQRDNSRVSIEVAEGSIEEVSMRDGTNVRMVGPATLSYVASESIARPSSVDLSGSAYFDVVGSGIPFVVRTATARVSVLGTNFGLRATPDVTDVVLASGRLSVSGAADEAGVVLEPGFASTVVKGQAPSAPEAVDLTDALSWAGLFVFRGTTVAEIAEKLSHHYGSTISVGHDLGRQLVSGTFDRDRELQEVLEVVAASLGASVVPTDDGFRLTGTAP